MSKIREALEAALHELSSMHGLILADGAAPHETWQADTANITALIDEAISELLNNENPLS